jgi:hypothetical protein
MLARLVVRPLAEKIAKQQWNGVRARGPHPVQQL